jgi:hypothetical protein
MYAYSALYVPFAYAFVRRGYIESSQMEFRGTREFPIIENIVLARNFYYSKKYVFININFIGIIFFDHS